MTFAFICDTFFRKKVSPGLVNGEIPNHNIITMTAGEFLENGRLPEGISGVLMEKGTWQKNFSMFRYFGLLPQLEKRNIAFMSSSLDLDFKGRLGMKNKEFVIHSATSPEDMALQLNRLAELTPPAFTHPRSRAIA
jgi:hypothetical protein